MADYGFRAVNDLGIVQIDSAYQNLCLMASGSVVPSTPTGFTSWRAGDAVVPYSPTAVVAFRSARPAFLQGLFPNGSTATARWQTYIAGDSAGELYWYVFDVPSASSLPSTNRYGMRVRDSSGQITYDSSLRNMRQVAFLSGTQTDVPNTNENQTPLTRTYQTNAAVPAVLQANQGTTVTEVVTSIGPPPEYMLFNIATCICQIGSQVALGNFVKSTGPYRNPTRESITRPNWAYTIIDVAGF